VGHQAGGPTPPSVPTGEPLRDAHRRATAGDAAARDEGIARYGFGLPTDEAIDLIAAWSPGGVVELGAGTGYWAHLLATRGLDVVAYDADPPPSATNPWFAGRQPWHPVLAGDERSAARHASRTLLLVWPTRGSVWAADAVESFHDAGGTRLVYVGEGPGGRTGDLRFHALLGTAGRCLACTYGVTDAPCTCDVSPLWRRRQSLDLPHWPEHDDQLEVYEARPPRGGPGWVSRLGARWTRRP
jgi:hypothetical protein